MKEEFDALGQPFARRGARMEEEIELLRTVWQGGFVEHRGEHYEIPSLQVEPHPPGPVPILIGGDSEVALRRAARIGDGWVGTLYTMDQLREIVPRLHRYRDEAGTADRPFHIQCSLSDRLPTPEVTAELDDLGVDTLITSAWLMEGLKYASLEENKAALERFAAAHIAPQGAGTGS
jgi:alkanesulfonate monooxygenase SsuD/methylene tetrahydromethanopterin reductase-like flavin-dependent oxidoreductase (luciferase family)